LQEKGWGEFDMRVVLYFTNNLVDPQVLLFDLNFAQSNYSTVKKVEFPDAPPEFAALLQKTLPPPRLSKRKGESDISSQEDNEESRPKVKMEDMEEGEESDGGYEKAAPAKKTKKIVQKKPERRVERQKKKGESSTSSNSDSEHDDKKKYNSAKKKPASTGNHEKVSKKSTVLKHIKSEEASPNTNLIPSTPIDPKMTPTKKRRLLDEVHIYSADDLDKLSPVHSFPVDDDTRRRWKIPKVNSSTTI
jgi:transcription initiation factor IIF auxiliary subunit